MSAHEVTLKVECSACTRKAEATHRCFHCAENICDHCAEMHKVLRVFANHRAVPFGNAANRVEECPKHSTVLNLFCTDPTCQCFICPQCAMPGEEHAGHIHGSIPDVAPAYRQEFDEKITPIRELKTRISENASHLKSCKDEIQKQNQQLPEKVHVMLQHVTASCSLEQRETTRLSTEEAAVLDKHLEYTKRAIDDLGNLLTFVDRLVESATDRDVLEARGQMSDVEEHIATLLMRYNIQEVNELQSYHVTTQLPTTEQVTNFVMDRTKVVLIKPPDPSKCSYEGPDIGETNQESCCRVLVMDSQGQPCNTPHDARVVFRSLASDSDRNVSQQVISTGTGSYKVLFTPIVRGSYSVEVTVNGTPIAGSPFRILVTLPPKQMGKGPVKVIPNMEGPARVSFIRESGHFAVSEWSGRRVRLMKTTGDQVGVIEYQAEFTGTEYEPDGYIYAVANSASQLIKFSRDGEIVKIVGSEGSGPGQFRYPTTICPYNREIIVVDCNNNRLQYFDGDLKFIREFHGDKQFPFRQPQGMTIDRSGVMYIADCGNRCIQKFRDDKLELIFGMDRMQSPTAVIVDKSGKYVLVTDYGKNLVFVFDTKGQYVHSFGGEGSDAGKFRYPIGLAMDGDGYLWVCDCLNNRLQVF